MAVTTNQSGNKLKINEVFYGLGLRGNSLVSSQGLTDGLTHQLQDSLPVFWVYFITSLYH